MKTPVISVVRDKKGCESWAKVLGLGAKKGLNLCSLEDQLRSGMEKETILHSDSSWDSDANTWQRKNVLALNRVISTENETQKKMVHLLSTLRKESGLGDRERMGKVGWGTRGAWGRDFSTLYQHVGKIPRSTDYSDLVIHFPWYQEVTDSESSERF